MSTDHRMQIVERPKMDAPNLVAARCSCGDYESPPDTRTGAAKSWAQHAIAKSSLPITPHNLRVHLDHAISGAHRALVEADGSEDLAMGQLLVYYLRQGGDPVTTSLAALVSAALIALAEGEIAAAAAAAPSGSPGPHDLAYWAAILVERPRGTEGYRDRQGARRPAPGGQS